MNIGEVERKLNEKFPGVLVSSHAFRDDNTVVVNKGRIRELFYFLRDDPAFLYNFMMDITAVDYFGKTPRFEMVYHLYSLKYNRRLRVKVPVTAEDATVDSTVPVWVVADWLEREVYDMYGITFNGHPNMKRILLYKEFKGHPLRKDYPVKKRQPLIGPDN